MLRASELDAELQVGSHQGREEGQNPLPSPAAHTSLDAAQDRVGLLGCKCTLPGHVQLLINQHTAYCCFCMSTQVRKALTG